MAFKRSAVRSRLSPPKRPEIVRFQASFCPLCIVHNFELFLMLRETISAYFFSTRISTRTALSFNGRIGTLLDAMETMHFYLSMVLQNNPKNRIQDFFGKETFASQCESLLLCAVERSIMRSILKFGGRTIWRFRTISSGNCS